MPDPRSRAQLFVAVVVVVAALLAGAWYGSQPAAVPMPTVTALTSAGTTNPLITIHVAGAVARPGLVSIPGGARVADAIAAAGGALAHADLGALNLADTVDEADRIDVPVRGAAPAASVATPGSGGVDLNRATAAELETLPGVGPVLAARIVAHREEHGPFDTVEELLDVPGIGEAKLAAIREAVAAP